MKKEIGDFSQSQKFKALQKARVLRDFVQGFVLRVRQFFDSVVSNSRTVYSFSLEMAMLPFEV